MGLDGVEFVMALEESFQICIPDEAAAAIRTPRDVVNYLLERLGQGDEGACLEQRAFYRIRSSIMRIFSTPRAAIRPGTRWDAVLPSRGRRHNWRLLALATRAGAWPRLPWWGALPAAVATVGGTSQYLAAHAPASFRQEREGFTRQEVEDVVRRLIHEVLAIKQFGWDQEFAKDLGVS